mgnify:CR=1 FL=1
MTTKETKEVIEPVTQNPEMGDAKLAEKRVQECYGILSAALTKYNCSIVPFVKLEQIGTGPLTKAVMECNYGVVPNA